MFDKNFYLALGSLIGAIIGVGIFGIPYVVSRAGFSIGVVYLIILSAIVLLLHLVYGEVVLRTKEKHRLPGYAGKYLGSWAKGLAVFAKSFGLFSALLAYIIVGAKFLGVLLPGFFSNQIIAGLVFWLVLSLGVWRGIKTVAWMEFSMAVFLIALMAVIVFWGAPQIDFANLVSRDLSQVVLPYGVILFALLGTGAVPEIKEILARGRKPKLLRIIVLGTLFPAFLYFVFTLVVVGVSGDATTQEAIQGLSQFLGKNIAVLGALFGILAVSTSFLLWGINLKKTFVYDLKIKKALAAALVLGIPILLFLFGIRSFVGVIGLAGVVIAVIEGTLILLMFKKAKTLGDRQPEYRLKLPSILLYFLIAIFILGVISQIL